MRMKQKLFVIKYQSNDDPPKTKEVRVGFRDGFYIVKSDGDEDCVLSNRQLVCYLRGLKLPKPTIDLFNFAIR